MSLYKLNILKKFYERYKIYGYGIDTWEDDLTGTGYLRVTELLFPNIEYLGSVSNSTNYTDVFIRLTTPYTLQVKIEEYISNQSDSSLFEDSSAIPARLKRIYYDTERGGEYYMSLLKLKKLKEMYTPYRNKYIVDIWETKLIRKEITGNLSITELLFPEIHYEEDNYNTDNGYIRESVFSYYPYTLVFSTGKALPHQVPKTYIEQVRAFSERITYISECNCGYVGD